MGWTGYDNLNHFNNVVNEELHNVKATDAELVKASVDALVNDQTRYAEPARCWYLAPNADGETYVGVILLDIDPELSPYLKTAPGSIYVHNQATLVGNDNPYVQVWMPRAVSLAEGPNHRDYPARFAAYAGR